MEGIETQTVAHMLHCAKLFQYPFNTSGFGSQVFFLSFNHTFTISHYFDRSVMKGLLIMKGLPIKLIKTIVRQT